MKCPVCGEDCIRDAHELIEIMPTIFAGCGHCKERKLNKRAPLKDRTIQEPCKCGKRFIDDVFAHMYVIMTETGVLDAEAPLARVGMPLVHPGFAMTQPPYLPKNSLVLLSRDVDEATAQRLVAEVPEVRGVIKSDESVPGLSDINFDGLPDTYTLLAGCDVRANIFTTQKEKIVVYKQQSVMHIEFPRGYDPKIVSVGVQVRHQAPKCFVDACSGIGTLGLVAALYDIPRVIFNDAWYAAAFWTAYNLKVNRENLNFDELICNCNYAAMKEHPVRKEPLEIAHTEGGKQSFQVYQGDFNLLHTVLPGEVDLSVIDIFEKRDEERVSAIIEEWKRHVSGEVFIP